MAGEDQAAKDERIRAALKAYVERDRIQPYEEQSQLWEALWEACDFSWEGLADAGWDRGDSASFVQKLKRWTCQGRKQTLQDYWREKLPIHVRNKHTNPDDALLECGLLIRVNDKIFHILHCNIELDNRTNVYLEEVIYDIVGLQNSQDRPILTIGSRNPSLHKIISSRLPQEKPLFITSSLSDIHHCEYDKINFGERSNFEFCNFRPMGKFFQCSFGKYSYFNDCLFGNNFSFASSIFQQDCWFVKSHFGLFSDFSYAKFAEEAWFFQCSFEREANFHNSNFARNANFSYARFNNGVNFVKAIFENESTFSNSLFVGKANFRSAHFLSDLDISSANVDEIIFEDVRIDGRMHADGARFTEKLNFRASEIKGHAGFANCIWPDRAQDHEAAFRGCRFRDVADFESPNFKSFAMFDGAEFKGRVLLAEPGGIAEDKLFAAAFEATELAAQAAREEFERSSPANAEQDGLTEQLKAYLADRTARRTAGQAAEQVADLHYGSLASGLRTLKQAVAAQGDREREQRFFRYEVQVRARRPTEGPFAKRAARIYGRTSNYGVSVGLPLVWAFGLGLAFAAVYGVVGLATGALQFGPSLDGPAQALQLSLSNSFRPFFVLETPRQDDSGFWIHLLRKNDWVSLVMRAVGVVQSLATIILLFLVGVALRRKFQIG